jgi:hypothetical protein
MPLERNVWGGCGPNPDRRNMSPTYRLPAPLADPLLAKAKLTHGRFDVFSSRMIFMTHGQANPQGVRPHDDLLAHFPYLGPDLRPGWLQQRVPAGFPSAQDENAGLMSA